jgi:hypothetical protein
MDEHEEALGTPEVLRREAPIYGMNQNESEGICRRFRLKSHSKLLRVTEELFNEFHAGRRSGPAA